MPACVPRWMRRWTSPPRPRIRTSRRSQAMFTHKEIPKTQVTVNEAISQAIAEEMRRDSRVIMFGEGVATKRPELLEEFGAQRVRNTPLAEGIIAGTAAGA